jgi:hypothetical protein
LSELQKLEERKKLFSKNQPSKKEKSGKGSDSNPKQVTPTAPHRPRDIMKHDKKKLDESDASASYWSTSRTGVLVYCTWYQIRELQILQIVVEQQIVQDLSVPGTIRSVAGTIFPACLNDSFRCRNDFSGLPERFVPLSERFFLMNYW